MANIEEAIRRLKYLYEVHGADQVTAAQAAITASTTGTERAALSLEKSFNSLERKYVSTVRAQQDYQRVQDKVNDAVKQNPALQARANVILENAAQQYQAASRGLNTYGKALDQSTQQGRLARHELINLSRQIQDVGVGIVSGQSPFTILVQQGAQIADVFASSTGTLAGFFKQAAAGAGRFIASTGGIVTGTLAVAGSLGYVVASYASGQRDIERSLTGIGRASGVTRDQINAIGQTSASAFGLSASEARTAATAFAATGTIYKDNVAAATSIINDFARGGGDAAEMTKRLAAALQDPAKGAQDLNKELGFLDATTLNYIRTLQAAGQKQEAQAALMKAMAPAVAEQAKHVGLLTQAWNAATNAVSNYVDRKGKEILQQFEQVTGVTAGGFSKEEQLQRATDQLLEVEKRIARINQQPLKLGLREAEAESSRLAGVILDLENAIDGVNRKAEEKALAQLSLEADAAARSIIGATAQIFELQKQMAALQKYRTQTGGPVTGAEQVGTVRLRELQEQEAATVRVAQATAQIAAQYPGMSIETAKQLFDMQQQLMVAQARTGAEKLVAQEIATTIQLLAQGKTLEEAMATAAAQRAVAQAQINSGAQMTLLGLQDQYAVSAAVTGQEKMAAQETATRNNLIRQGVDATLAGNIAAQERANTEAQINAQAQEMLLSLEDQYAVVSAITGRQKMAAQEQATYNKLVRQGVDVVLASTIAAQERANAEAAVTAAVERQIIGLEEQLKLIEARTAGAYEFARVSGEIARQRAIQEGASAGAAFRLQQATEKLANAQNELTGEVRRTASAMREAGDAYKNTFGKTQGTELGSHPIIVRAPWAMNMDLARAIKTYGREGIETEGEGIYEKFIRANQQGIESLINQTLGSGGTIEAAIAQAIREGEPGQQVAQQLLDLLPEAQQKAAIQQMIAQLTNEPRTLARETLLKQLNDQLKGLTESVDALNGTLSPYYSQDPRTTKLGFRAGVVGNPEWMTGATNQTAIDTILGKGAIAPGGITINAPGGVTVTAPGSTVPITGTVVTPPIIQYDPITTPGITGSQITPLMEAQRRQRAITGINSLSATGMASGGSFVVGGGYSATDNRMAQFPVASGEQVVVNRRPQDARPIVVHNDNRIIVQGSVDQDTLSKLKVSRYQQTQRMRGAIAAA